MTKILLSYTDYYYYGVLINPFIQRVMYICAHQLTLTFTYIYNIYYIRIHKCVHHDETVFNSSVVLHVRRTTYTSKKNVAFNDAAL